VLDVSGTKFSVVLLIAFFRVFFISAAHIYFPALSFCIRSHGRFSCIVVLIVILIVRVGAGLRPDAQLNDFLVFNLTVVLVFHRVTSIIIISFRLKTIPTAKNKQSEYMLCKT